MRTVHVILTTSIVWLFIMIAALAVRAVQPVPVLRISTPQAVVETGNEIPVIVDLYNASMTAFEISRLVGEPANSYLISVVDLKSGNELQELESARFRGGSFSSAIIGPKETRNESFILNREFDLSNPGRYAIKILAEDKRGRRVHSNVLAIEVKP